jgi:hypothetical protein
MHLIYPINQSDAFDIGIHRDAGKSIIGGGGGQIFIYSCSQTVKTIAFKGNK